MKKMKRYLLLFSVLACVLALTACGKKSDKDKTSFTYDEKELVECLTSNTETVAGWSNDAINAAIDKYGDSKDNKAMKDGLEQYKNAKKDSGKYEGFYLDDSDNVKYKISTDKDSVTITAKAKFTKRNVKVIYTFGLVDDNVQATSIVYEPQYSLGEKMEKAALNTVMGLTTVAIVLIFLSILISLFRYINKAQNALANKNKKDDAIDKTIVQIESKEESEYSDDTELIAVITAAIAMSEQKSTDGFVVRSIRRVPNRKWNR